MLKVKKVQPNRNLTLNVELSDGRVGAFDMKPFVNKGVFVALHDYDNFKKVRPFLSGILWESGADLSADTISCGLLSPNFKHSQDRVTKF